MKFPTSLRFAVWTLFLVATGNQAILAEIPAGPEVSTSRDYATQEIILLERLILEPYIKNRAARDAQQTPDDPAEDFLRMWIEHATKGFGNIHHGPLVDKGKQAIESGCNDAMVLYCYGRILRQAGQFEEGVTHLKAAFETLEQSGYDVSFRCWAISNWALGLGELQRTEEAKEVDSKVLDYVYPVLASKSYLPDEQRILYRHVEWFFETYPVEKLQGIVDQMESNNDIDPWLKDMLNAKLEIRLAWEARGGSWASEVTEEGWEGFEGHLEQAQARLRQAWMRNNQHPESATEMIQIAMAGYTPPNETPRYWFDQAVSAQLDYGPAYNSLRYALLPRWGGSQAELYAFGKECLDTGRFDTYVPYQFLLAFELLLSDIGSDLNLYKAPGVYEDLLSLADGYLAQPPTDWNHPWYKTLKVGFAARCGKWEEARQFLDNIGGDPRPDAFARLALEPDPTIGEVYARSKGLAAGTAEGDQLLENGQFEEAREKFRELQSQGSSRKQVVAYYHGRLHEIDLEQQFAQGKRANLLPDAQLTGWHSTKGNWRVDERGRLVGRSGHDGLMLIADKKFGMRFEIQGKATFLSSPYTNRFNIGVYFGQETGTLRNSFKFFHAEQYAAVKSSGQEVQKRDCPIGATNSFLVQRWDDTLYASLNDAPVLDGVTMELYGAPEKEVVGIGGSYWYPGAIIRFDELKIRKLNQRPPGVESE